MVRKPVETSVGFYADRTFSPRMAGEFAKTLEDSGVVDMFQAWDQTISWWPQSLWQAENTSWATVMKDCDSFADAFQLCAFAAAATTTLGVSSTTDAIRRGPAELLQTMLTLASATEGRAAFQFGGGEAKQARPWGHKRAEGLKRLEDIFRIFRLLLENDEPIDFEGNIWNLNGATIGSARPYLPRMWVLGGGPQIIDIATKYADGFVSSVPHAYPTPELWAKQVTEIKHKLEDNGRDPDLFTFGIWTTCLIHDDQEVIERSYSNPLLKFIAAIGGRLNQRDWEREGITPVMPVDYHYALKLFPRDWTAEAAKELTEKVPLDMVRRSYNVAGTPKEVANRINEYVEAGATWTAVFDFLPVTLSLEDSAAAADRSIEVCRLLKA